jgi:hypothetical protein
LQKTPGKMLAKESAHDVEFAQRRREQAARLLFRNADLVTFVAPAA